MIRYIKKNIVILPRSQSLGKEPLNGSNHAHIHGGELLRIQIMLYLLLGQKKAPLVDTISGLLVRFWDMVLQLCFPRGDGLVIDIY